MCDLLKCIYTNIISVIVDIKLTIHYYNYIIILNFIHNYIYYYKITCVIMSYYNIYLYIYIYIYISILRVKF